MLHDPVGRRLERRFDILRRIGRGGMGIVYLAWDWNLKRKVVIKVPHAHLLGTAKARRRFRREMLSLAKLDHPHIVRILHAGVEEDTPFFVMEHLRGGTLLERLVQRDRVDPSLWLPGIAASLDYLHRRGVVHRDVKPGNILFDERERPCLADFGLVRLPRIEATLQETLAPGSVDYMAPEQAAGDHVTGAADQYALASIVYAAFAGHVPFGTGPALAILQRKFTDDPPPLSSPGLPPKAAAVVLRGLARDPAARFASCGEFARALEEARTGLAPRRRRSQRRVTLAVGPWVRAVAVLLLGILAWLYLPRLLQGRPAQVSAAASPRDEAPTDDAPSGAAGASVVGVTEDSPAGARADSPASLPARSPRPAQPAPEPAPEDSPADPTAPPAEAGSTDVERARALVSASRDAADPTLSFLLARAGLAAANCPETRGRIWELSSIPLERPARPDPHTDRITHAAFAIDGNRLLTASADGSARVWSIEGRLLVSLKGHTGVVLSVVARGRRFLTTATDGTARLWSENGISLATLQHEQPPLAAWFEGDGTILTIEPAAMRVWTPDGAPKTTTRTDVRLAGAALSPTGAHVVGWSDTGSVRVWDISGRRVAAFAAHSAKVFQALISPDGSRVATAAEDAKVKVWSVDGELLHALKRTKPVRSIAFTSAGDLVSSDGDGGLWLSDAKGRERCFGRARGSIVRDVDVSRDGWVLATSEDGSTCLWDPQRLMAFTMQQCASSLAHGGPVLGASFSPDGTRVLTVSDTARLWDRAGNCLLTLREGGQLADAQFAKPLTHVIGSYDDSECVVWDLNGRRVAAFDDNYSVACEGGHVGGVCWGSIWFIDLATGIRTCFSGKAEGTDSGRALWLGLRGFGKIQLFMSRDGSRALVQGKGWCTAFDRATGPHAVVKSVASALASSGEVAIWDHASRGRLSRGDGDPGVALDRHQGTFSASGERLLTADDEGWTLYDRSGGRIASWRRTDLGSLMFLEGSDQLWGTAARRIDGDQVYKLFDPAGRPLGSTTPDADAVAYVRRIPLTDKLLVRYERGPVRLLNLERKVARELSTTSIGATLVGGGAIVVANKSTVSTWDLDGNQRGLYEEPRAAFSGLIAHADGDTFAAVTDTGQLCLFDMSGHLLATLKPNDSIVAAAVARGELLLTRHRSGALRLYATAIEVAVESARGRARREFTEEERQRYGPLLGRR